MMSEACREFRPLLGAAVLGGLDPSEDIALQAHLDGCRECRAEMRDLEAVGRALPLADIARIDDRIEPSKGLGQRVLARVAEERAVRRRRHRRSVAIGAAIVAAAAAVMIALALTLPSDSPSGTRVAFPETDGVRAHAILRGRAAGTEVAFHGEGLRAGEAYWLWLTGEDGDRIGAGTFRGTARPVDVTLTAAIPLRDTVRLWVTDEDDRIVLDQVLTSES
jgi:hypothetical protein